MQWLYVALGGALGSLLRYGATTFFFQSGSRFPIALLLVNILGSFLLGALAGLLAVLMPDGYLRSPIYLFGGIGLLGGFTTFSAFSLETVRLAQESHPIWAFSFVATTILGTILACAAGIWLATGLKT